MFVVFLLYLTSDWVAGRSALTWQQIRWMLLLYAGLLGPIYLWPVVRLEGQIKCLLLLALVGLLLVTPMPSTLFGDLPARADAPSTP